MRKNAIIIGAGIGGLATAVRLAGRGFSVTVYEKESRIGGRANLLAAHGFRFDLTASILMLPQSIREVFDCVEKNCDDYLEFIRLDPIYRAYYPDGRCCDFSSDLVKLTHSLESFSQEDVRGYLMFLSDTYQKYQLAYAYFLQNPYRRAIDFFNPVSLFKALQLKTLSTAHETISSYVHDEAIQKFLCFQALLVGISPYEGPGIYTMLPAVSQLYGLWHLKGGMYAFVEALEKVLLELGGKIKTDEAIGEIIIRNRQAIGVKIESGQEITADLVVCNADFPYAMSKLIQDEKAKGPYTDKKLANLRHSCSTFILYLGLRKKLPQLLVHTLYLGEDFRENLEAAFKGWLPGKPSLYVYCPTRVDDSMAGPGMECINVVVRVPNLMCGKIMWDPDTIGQMKEVIYQTLGRIKGLENIKEHVVFESQLTPLDLQDRFNAYGGTAFGLSPTLLQSNYFRPHVKSPDIRNLYFTGNSVHPGTGVSMVLLSSRLAAEEVLKDFPNS